MSNYFYPRNEQNMWARDSVTKYIKEIESLHEIIADMKKEHKFHFYRSINSELKCNVLKKELHEKTLVLSEFKKNISQIIYGDFIIVFSVFAFYICWKLI